MPRHKPVLFLRLEGSKRLVALLEKRAKGGYRSVPTLPEGLYLRVTDGDKEAVRILLHELGHLFLLHDPALHIEPEAPPCRNEDSEYQADAFADRMMEKIFGRDWRSEDGQLELFL